MPKLSEAEQGHLKYLLSLVEQPAEKWAGFYRTPSDGMNFGLRFQLAFSAYALYGLARRTPAYRAPYLSGLEKLLEKMLQPEVWAYWFQGAVRSLPVVATNPPDHTGTIEFLHSRLGMGGHAVSPDPCLEGNVQYSGHLACMLGFYELLGGSKQYNEPGFVLKASAGGQVFEFPYTYSGLAARLHEQMAQNYFHGVCCEPGRAYAACNNHACISNVLHDQLYGTNYAAVNVNWANWVRDKMLTGRGPLPLPAPNGLLSVAYLPDLHLSLPVSFNLTDAWGLAFMAAWQPEMVRETYPRFRKRLKAKGEGLRLGSLGPNENLEISTEGLNTAFAFLLAQEMGDQETARRLLQYAQTHLSATQDERGLYFASKPAPYLTALFALGRALSEEEGAGGMASLIHWRPDFGATYLAAVSASEVMVNQAEYLEGQGLVIGLAGEPGTSLELSFANCPRPQSLQIDQTELNLEAANLYYDENQRILKLNFELASRQTNLKLGITG